MEKEGTEAKINISLAYQLHLLEIIERANNFLRENNIIGMSREIEMLYEGLVDKIPEKERKDKHEVAQKNANECRNSIMLLDLKMRASDAHNRGLFRRLGQEKAHKLFQLNEMISDWKKELILVMSKNKMLVVIKKRVEDEV